MAQFNKSFELVLGNEGGYANVSGDKGGETYKGIARVYNPSWPGWATIDRIKNHRALKRGELISDTTLDLQVKELYRAKYWNLIRGDEILNQRVADALFDFSVMTITGAAKCIQQALNDVGQRIEVDGKIGRQTIEAINRANGDKLLERFTARRIAYHKERVQKDPSQAKFIVGWINRAMHFSTGTVAAVGIPFFLIGAVALVFYLSTK